MPILAERLEVCGMIGRSPAMRELFSVIHRLAPHARTVLVTGETGTGKELVAHALHELGPRKARKLVTVNCSAVVETLFESRVVRPRPRRVYRRDRGQDRRVRSRQRRHACSWTKSGSCRLARRRSCCARSRTARCSASARVEMRKVDVRVIAATNRRLDVEIAAGRFRSDLYYRLNVVEITVPPLRERSEDIPYLTAAFVKRFSREFGKEITGLTDGAEERLVKWSWPGNVRELRNVIERACLLCEGHLLTEGDLARSLSERRGVILAVADGEPSGPPPTPDEVRAALDSAGGNKSLAARRLGISRRALYRLLDKYGELVASPG